MDGTLNKVSVRWQTVKALCCAAGVHTNLSSAGTCCRFLLFDADRGGIEGRGCGSRPSSDPDVNSHTSQLSLVAPRRYSKRLWQRESGAEGLQQSPDWHLKYEPFQMRTGGFISRLAKHRGCLQPSGLFECVFFSVA